MERQLSLRERSHEALAKALNAVRSERYLWLEEALRLHRLAVADERRGACASETAVA